MITAPDDELYAIPGGARASASTDRGRSVLLHTPTPPHQTTEVHHSPGLCASVLTGVVTVIPAAAVFHDVAQQCEPMDLELKLEELLKQNAELEHRLDTHGLQFLEALAVYENKVTKLTEQNRQLMEGDANELLSHNLRMERECQDMLQQLDAFEHEKEDEVRLLREEVARLTRQLEDQERRHQRLLAEAERDRDAILQAMTDEGQELQSRVDKLSRDKEALSLDLAKALARADVAVAANTDAMRGSGGSSQVSFSLAEASIQLRAMVGEREALKDEVTNKEGQTVLLKSQLEIADRKLRLTDMENAMLKNEIEVLRRSQAGRSGTAVAPASHAGSRAGSGADMNGHR